MTPALNQSTNNRNGTSMSGRSSAGVTLSAGPCCVNGGRTMSKINYAHEDDWGGYTLRQHKDNTWIYESWSAVQGNRSGRKVILSADITVLDVNDMDTQINKYAVTKADYIIAGHEIRCLRRGWVVQ